MKIIVIEDEKLLGNTLLHRQRGQVDEMVFGNTALDLGIGALVCGDDSNAVENHVEVYVGFLRKKLASIGSDVRIASIRRLGYHLEINKA